MSICKKTLLTFNGYSITLDSPLCFYQNDTLYLQFDIDIFGLTFNNQTIFSDYKLDGLTIQLFIKDDNQVSEIEITTQEQNSISCYLGLNYTQKIGTKLLQFILTDASGCKLTLPAFELEIRERLSKDSVNAILTEDEKSLVTENGDFILSSIPSSIKISDLPELTEIHTQSFVPIVADNTTLKFNLQNLETDAIDLSQYATKDDLDSKADLNHTHSEYLTELPKHTHDYSTLTNLPSIPSLEGLATKDDLDSKADLNHTHSEYLTELPEHTHDYSTLTNLPSIPSLEGLATVSYVNQAIADLIKDYGLTLTSDPDSNPDPTPDPTPDSTDDKSYEGNGTKYYVSPKGNNSNSGTSIDKPFQTINAALSKAVGGDIIYLRDGTYNEDITLTRSGSLGNYITIRNYPGETPILDRQSTGIIGIDLGKTSYININGLEICNLKQPQKNGTAAIGIYKEEGGSHIVIQNCTFHDINAYSSTGGDGNWASAIKLVGVTSTKISNVIIKNNLIYNCILGWNEALAIESNIEYVDILNNTIHDVTNIGIDIAGNFGECSTKSLDQARYINLIGNIVYNCISPYATCAGLYVDGARDVLIERNISYGNMTGIEVGAEMSVTSYPVKNITVRNNLIYGNTEYGIMCGGYYSGAGNVQDTHFYNNTVIHGGSNTTIEMSKSQNIDFVNNIFYCTNSNNITDHDSSLTSSMSNITFNYNNFYSTKNTSPSSTIAQIMGKEYTNTTLKSTFNSNQTLTNPQFTSISSNDYTLSSNSACINAGTSSNIEVGEQDLIGNNRISGSSIDMGCYEI